MITRSAVVALVLLFGRSAQAQYDDAPVERSPPRPQSTSLPRIHDGFYASFHVGPSYFMASSEPESTPDAGSASREFTGPSLAMRIAIGGTFRNRVVLGAMLAFEPLMSLTAKDESGEEFETYGAKFVLRQQGALLDYYFLPRGGFHLLGSIGFAQLAVTRTELDDDSDYPAGTYWMLGFGHEWWAADSASFGVLASVTDGSLEVQERTRVDVDLFSFGLALTATIN